MMDVSFFSKPEDFRRWFLENHDSQTELWVGFYKKGTGIPSITWPESVDEALCYGWIDGIRKSIDSERYKIRFTPRTVRSHWSDVNIKRMPELIKEGRMQEAGLKAFARRTEKRSRQAAHEQDEVSLPEPFLKRIKDIPEAWAFFQTLSPYYLKSSIWFVISAKQEKTKEKRLQILIDSCVEGKKIPQLRND